MTTPGFDDNLFAIYEPRATEIEPLVGRVDGYLSEEHEASVSHTSYPVESGASLTDHAVRRPDKLKLEGWVSDLLPADTAFRGAPLQQRAAEAWGQIDLLMTRRRPLTVTTRLKVYRNMLLTKASAPVNGGTGYGLRFTLELEEVLVPAATGDCGRVVAGSGGRRPGGGPDRRREPGRGAPAGGKRGRGGAVPDPGPAGGGG